MRYGRQNPLRLALAVLKREYPIVIPQRNGIWIGSDLWVTFGSPAYRQDLIVDKARGVTESYRRRAVKILRKAGFWVLTGCIYDL